MECKFSFYYDKPGPGVLKNARREPLVIHFLKVLRRKFWHLIKLNMLFFSFNLPAVIAAFLIFSFFLSAINDNSLGSRLAAAAFFICIPVLTVGPAQAGFTYVLRKFANEEHAFIWWDFKDQAKRNAKQSLIISLVDLFVIILAGLDIVFYLKAGSGNIIFFVTAFFISMLVLIYLMMHLYIYPMLITFKLSLVQLYKNALIFAILRFFSNMGILALCFAVSVLPILILPSVGLLVFILFTMSASGLITNFYVSPILKKYMIDLIS